MKLIAKERIGSKTIKRYDAPKTPYQRIMESPLIAPASKLKLAQQVKTLNPFLLRKSMESKLKVIFDSCYKYQMHKDLSQLFHPLPHGNIYL